MTADRAVPDRARAVGTALRWPQLPNPPTYPRGRPGSSAPALTHPFREPVMSHFAVRDFVGSFPLRFLVQNPWVDPATGEAGCDSLGTIEVNGVEAVVVFTDERWARRFLTATGFNRAGGEL